MYNTLFFIDIEKQIILSYLQFISTFSLIRLCIIINFVSDKTVHYHQLCLWQDCALSDMKQESNLFSILFWKLWVRKSIPLNNSSFQNIENLCSIKQSNLLDFSLGNGRAINDDEKRTAIDTLFEYLEITLTMNSYLIYAAIWRNPHLQARMPSRYFSGMFMMNR